MFEKVFLAGHNGMVGRAILLALKKAGYENIITIDHTKLDLCNTKEVFHFIEKHQPDIVIDAAAKVGGIYANSVDPYSFLMQNLLIQNNLIDSSFKLGVKKFIFLGSSCVYPKNTQNPIKEESLLTGSLEQTNEYYAIAKIAGIKACEAIANQHKLDYFSLMPPNLYGPSDNFDLVTSHVVAALIKKIHLAKISKTNVTLWGSGKPIRELMFVEDFADALVFLLNKKETPSLINVGVGKGIDIHSLAKKIQLIVGHLGAIEWDEKMPDGTPQKILDTSYMSSLGWHAKTPLEEGLKKTYEWFIAKEKN
jgi:GDP-L-fucose synthase